jgi:hypothetical protein
MQRGAAVCVAEHCDHLWTRVVDPCESRRLRELRDEGTGPERDAAQDVIDTSSNTGRR